MRFLAPLLLLLMMLAPGPAPAADFVERYNAAMAAHRAQNYAEMERLLREALALRPLHPAATYELAAALARQNKRDEALDELRRLARQGLAFEPDKDKDGDFAALKDVWGYGSVRREFERNGTRKVGRPTTLFKLVDPSFIPDAVAFDEDRRHYFVGSVRHRRIQRILRDGQESDFVRQGYGGLWSALGMAADASKRLLWVATAALPEMAEVEPDSLGQTGLVAYDLETNERKARYLLKDAGEHRLTDLVVLRNGMVYATDSKGGLLYSLHTTSGQFEALTAPGQLASPQGIAVNDDKDVLYIADYTQGLFRYEIETRKLERMDVDPKVCVYGIDGLARWKNQLIAVQNGVRPHRVVRLLLADRGRRVRASEVLAANLEEFDEPTHGIVEGNRFVFVANSQRDRFTKDHQLPPKSQLRRPTILRLALDEQRPEEEDAFRDRGLPQQQPPQQQPLPLPLPR